MITRFIDQLDGIFNDHDVDEDIQVAVVNIMNQLQKEISYTPSAAVEGLMNELDAVIENSDDPDEDDIDEDDIDEVI